MCAHREDLGAAEGRERAELCATGDRGEAAEGETRGEATRRGSRVCYAITEIKGKEGQELGFLTDGWLVVSSCLQSSFSN